MDDGEHPLSEISNDEVRPCSRTHSKFELASSMASASFLAFGKYPHPPLHRTIFYDGLIAGIDWCATEAHQYSISSSRAIVCRPVFEAPDETELKRRMRRCVLTNTSIWTPVP